MPWYIIVGPPGAGKTTALVNSTLEFPLAEQFGKAALRGVGGTRNCDWWFTNEAVLIDTAGRYTTQDSHRAVDSSAWEGFLHLLKRNRRRRPVNGVIVAISLHDLLTQTEEERAQQAKVIRSRIDELMSKLEIRFPIYVMFTKADLISGFCEFFEDLSKEEREQVWGISLPNAPKASHSPDFDFLSAEFNKLLARIHERALSRIHQERDINRRGVIHGFPQQLQNLRAIIESFVRQTFIKNRYQYQPYLRGVYLTSGVQDGNPIDRLMTSVAASFGFSRDVSSTPHQQGKSFFLGNLFRQVIFPESELVGSNAKYEQAVRWSQRLAYIALAGITAVVILVWAGSVTRNKFYLSEVSAYIDEFRPGQTPPGSLNSDVSNVLPQLNALANASIVYDQEKHPWLKGLGLYDARVDDRADLAYLSQLKQLLLPRLIGQLEMNLRQGHRGGDLYNTFRIYMMFNKLEHMDNALVGDWFHGSWERQFPGEATPQQALKKHLEVLLTLDLPSSELNSSLIANTRTLLRRVPPSQRIYSRIRTHPKYSQKIDMLNYFGESMRETYIVDEQSKKASSIPFMFTKEGYDEIDLSPDSPLVADIVNDDHWVLSDDKKARVDFVGKDLNKISEQAEEYYLSEYVRRWSDLYASLNIRPFNNLQHANDMLTRFTDPVYSPLLSTLKIGSTNTRLSSPPMQDIVEDTTAEGNIEGNKLANAVKSTSYLADMFEGNKVDKSFRTINDLLKETPKRPAPIGATMQKIQQLQDFIAEISVSPDPSKKAFDIAKARYQSGSGNAITALSAYANDRPEPVKRWLNTMADESWKVVLGAARNHISSEWKSQVYPACTQGLAGLYPLSKHSRNESALLDFNEFFKPGGKVDAFYQAYLNPFIDARSGWQNRSVDGRSMGFSGNTLAQVRKALDIKNIFFRINPETPSLTLELRPYRMNEQHARFTLDVGEQRISYNHGPRFWKTVNWSGADDNKRIRLTFEDLNGNVYSDTYEGSWAWFRLQDASQLRKESSSNRYLATFSVLQNGPGSKAHTITYELKAKSVKNPFSRNLLSTFRCPSSI